MNDILAKVYWHNTKGEALINLTTAFENEDTITRLDFLKDCKDMFDDLYNKELREP
jgi:hypothetical protein